MSNHTGFHAIFDCDFKNSTTEQEKTQAAQTIAGWRTTPPNDPDWRTSVTIGTVSLMANDPTQPNKPGGQLRVEATSNQANRDDAHKDFQKIEIVIRNLHYFDKVQHTCCYIDY